MLVQDFLQDNAPLLPDKAALICDNHRLTYMEIDSLSNLPANALLEYGFQRGALVGTNPPPADRLLLSSFIDLVIPRL